MIKKHINQIYTSKQGFPKYPQILIQKMTKCVHHWPNPLVQCYTMLGSCWFLCINCYIYACNILNDHKLNIINQLVSLISSCALMSLFWMVAFPPPPYLIPYCLHYIYSPNISPNIFLQAIKYTTFQMQTNFSPFNLSN